MSDVCPCYGRFLQSLTLGHYKCRVQVAIEVMDAMCAIGWATGCRTQVTENGGHITDTVQMLSQLERENVTKFVPPLQP